MIIFDTIEQLAVLPVLWIPTGLLPINNASDSSWRTGYRRRKDDVAQGKVAVCEEDVPVVGQQIAIYSFDPRHICRGLLASGCYKDPVVEVIRKGPVRSRV